MSGAPPRTDPYAPQYRPQAVQSRHTENGMSPIRRGWVGWSDSAAQREEGGHKGRWVQPELSESPPIPVAAAAATAAAAAALCVYALIIMTDRLVHEVGQVHGHASCIEAVVDTHARTFARAHGLTRVCLSLRLFFFFSFSSFFFFFFRVLCSSYPLPLSSAALSSCRSTRANSLQATSRVTNTIGISADRLRVSFFDV